VLQKKKSILEYMSLFWKTYFSLMTIHTFIIRKFKK